MITPFLVSQNIDKLFEGSSLSKRCFFFFLILTFQARVIVADNIKWIFWQRKRNTPFFTPQDLIVFLALADRVWDIVLLCILHVLIRFLPSV